MTDNASQNATGHTLDDAADAMAGLVDDLFDLDDNEAAENDAKPKDDASQEAQGDEDEDATEETKSDDESDEEAEESESDEDTEQPEGKPDQMVTVKVDGKTVAIPLSEAIAGYQRQADYSRKTQTLSEERKQFDSNRAAFETEAKGVREERQQYKVVLGQLTEVLNQFSPQEPDPQLFATDPNAYLIQKEQWRMVHDQKQAAASELQRLKDMETTEYRKQVASHVEAGANKLLEWIPTWKDEGVRSTELRNLVVYARNELGYSNEELQAAVDPRALHAVYKAMKFDELQARTKNLKPTVKGKTISAGSPQHAGKGGKRSNAVDRLARTGSLEDAAAAFSEMDF